MAQLPTDTAATQMLWAVAEQLKVPLSVIARRAELMAMDSGSSTPQTSADIRTQADIALALVDSYLLGLELWRVQSKLPLETVSISSALTDIAQGLYKYARQYDVTLKVDIEGRYGPIMAHARGLQAALLSMGCAMIESQAQQEGERSVTLAVHRTSQGIAAGMYSTDSGFEADTWRQVQRLQGLAHQPHAAVGGSGAELFVADTILQAMETQLCTGKHGNQTGLRATFMPSKQLTLV